MKSEPWVLAQAFKVVGEVWEQTQVVPARCISMPTTWLSEVLFNSCHTMVTPCSLKFEVKGGVKITTNPFILNMVPGAGIEPALPLLENGF